ncbi:M48 family metallopeptidase [Tautonia sociabilis]|uniref:Zn-dependent protease with chaperone function n=1 Tax=Tautonia sociabilis TaxID=2080755 RepID=A0A432MPF0_9BACT|nr:M48 family metallopeptidase [Tautonia sociabilis]RUL89314.1 Zn-dependent protease with chaperone function [Tautonia sociabilis]
MDFFEHQEVARRKTGLLVFYFILAVIAIIAAVYLAIAGILLGLGGEESGVAPSSGPVLWDPGLFGIVAVGVSALVGGGSLFKIASLSRGGHTVAELLGGRLVHPDTRDPDERRLLNVVEEMAIASGTPVPPVYLLDKERGINAFAAGFSPEDAVIGVTRGCVRTLSRDELQGVMAHEFSHILNGDMRLNIRLMGVLFGILLIGITGWIIFRSTLYSGMRASDDRKGGNPLPLIGLALYVIGYVGVFFGRLIQAAVSRQREYLADASAVQFTRNPEGIAGALKKIGALAEGSKLEDPEAGEAAHMYFGDGVGGAWLSLLATHPPLTDRIRRIDPQFDGDFSKVSLEPPSQARVDRAGFSPPNAPAQERMRFDPVEAITRIGTVDPQRLAYAAGLLESLPDPVQRLTRDPYSARALVYALLLDPNDRIREAQLRSLAEHADPKVFEETRKAIPKVAGIDPAARLPLVELAIPSLRQLSADQFRDFQRNIRALMEADRSISLFEFALLRLLMRHLGSQFGGKAAPSIRYRSPEAIARPTAVLLSAISRVGQVEGAPNGEVRSAFNVGARALKWEGIRLSPEPDAGLEEIGQALDVLAQASPTLKRDVLRGCASAVAADGRITVQEGELLRAIADSLGSPMPPILGDSS